MQQDYWDLSGKERAALTREEVATYQDGELMRKGVLKVAPLQLDDVPEVLAKSSVMYRVSGEISPWDRAQVLLGSTEHAEAFLRMKPCFRKSEYVDGETIEFAVPFADKIERVEILALNEYTRLRSELERAAATKAANKKRREEHDKASKAQASVLQGLWEDWHEQRAKAARMQQVVETFREYVRLAGSEETAARFLLKVFKADEIAEACEWCGVSIPLPDETTEAIEPAVPACEEAVPL